MLGPGLVSQRGAGPVGFSDPAARPQYPPSTRYAGPHGGFAPSEPIARYEPSGRMSALLRLVLRDEQLPAQGENLAPPVVTEQTGAQGCERREQYDKQMPKHGSGGDARWKSRLWRGIDKGRRGPLKATDWLGAPATSEALHRWSVDSLEDVSRTRTRMWAEVG